MKNKKFKKTILFVIIFLALYWVFAPYPGWGFPPEYLFKIVIPKYPYAQNVKHLHGCNFEFEVDQFELADVKSFYNNSLIMKLLFRYEEGRSHSRTSQIKTNGKKYLSGFNDNYEQRFNLTSRYVHIYGANYTEGTKVTVECKRIPWF